MRTWAKILIPCIDIVIAGYIFFLLASSQPVAASEILSTPTRRSVTADWVEIVVVVAASLIIYILGSLYASGQWVWGWKKSEHLRVLGESNDNNYVKIRRYTTPFHLVVAVLVHYFLENIYFVVVVIFQMFCGCSPTGKHSTYPGLIIAAAAKLILTAAEEANLYFDERKANSSKYKQIIYERTQAQAPNNAAQLPAWAGVASDIAEDITSGEICRGRVVLVKNEQLVPVDGIILASSEPITTPILFNEAGLTGESAPAAKFPLNIGVDYSQCPDLKDFASVARCVRQRLASLDPVVTADEPTTSNVQFAGTIRKPRVVPGKEAEGTIASFDYKNAAYRGSTLHGTDWVLLLAVYTGPATKERLVTIKKTGVKDTPLDKELGKLIMNWNLPFIGILSLSATLHSFYLTNSGTDFLALLSSVATLKQLGLEWIVNFLFLNGLNNLSTRFFGDVVRIGQCRNMSVDSHMVIETNRAIPDSLGNVQVIISDKTGTLTKNELKCERLIIHCDRDTASPEEFSLTNPVAIKQVIQRRDAQSKAVERFLTFMAVANGVMPKSRPSDDQLSKETVYFSSNPDDLEFVNIAKALDTELMDRFTSIDGHQFVRVRTRLEAPAHEQQEDEARWHTVKMQLLQEHEFVSSRKYMSAVLKCPGSDGDLDLRSSLSSSPCQVLLVLKGADEKVDTKLSHDSPFKNRLIDLVSPYTKEGKRVLVWAYKFMSLEDYQRWEKEKPANSARDPEAVEAWWRLVEKDLNFAGCTVVSDKLQDGVEDVITYARECGIKVVMATGDSADTAESIWRKLRQIQGPVYRLVYSSFVTLNSEQRVVLDDAKLRDAMAQFDAIKPDDRAVLLIDGDMLLALQKARRERRKLTKSLDLFDSVVAARMTAAQKAEINRLYQSLGKTTLAIGDGANDITMIQEATVSVGLKSAETESAAQAADFKIQEFRNLQGLLVYGLQNYFRLSTVYLWNDYKAIILALTPFISRWWSAFSGGNIRGESIIPGDVIFMLTTVVLSLPVVMFGIFDVPISVQELVASPRHYKVNRHKRFDTKKKLMWWLSACIHTCIILYTIINYWADHENALVVGVMTGQIIAVVTNMRLIFEARRGFHVADSWRLLIASFASMVLTIPVSNLNPAFDAERRLKLGGTLDLPKLEWSHVQAVLLVAATCLAVDVLLYALFGESHVLSYLKRKNQAGSHNQSVDDDDEDDDDEPGSHPKSE